MTTLNSATLEKIINHVFLPPKLPQEEDASSDFELPNVILSAVEELKTQHGSEFPDQVLESATTMLSSVCSINHRGHIDELALERYLRTIAVGQTIAMLVTAQNAAILVTRATKDFIFECFELSAPNDSVMTTKGTLRYTVPSKGVSIPTDTVNDADFIQVVSTTVAKMSTQVVAEFQPKSRKSGTSHTEDRDTVDPTVVSGLLFGVLSGIGAPATTTAITKRVRDEILWTNTRRPWRRSPMWLLIRTTLQLVIQRSTTGTRNMYKVIMAWIMGYILRRAIDHGLSMDSIFIMECKISRRLSKLTAVAADYSVVTRSLRTLLLESHIQLKARWQAIQDKENMISRIDPQALKSLDLDADSCLSLHDLDKHLSATDQQEGAGFKPDFKPTSKLFILTAGAWPALDISPGCSQAEQLANLHRFEVWVAEELASPTAPSSTMFPKRLLQRYHALASARYMDNPEAWSVMLLTAFSLLVLCDQAAVRECPLLADYTPDIPIDVLQSLVLPWKHQMQQLQHIEQYISSRKAVYGSSELFNVSGVNGFAVRFFDRSNQHQQMLDSITRAGQEARNAKLREFAEKKSRYQRLKAESESHIHEMRTVIVDNWCNPPETRQEHVSTCERCRLEREYRSIKIHIHEWPISQHQATAKTTVFELVVPDFYTNWRDCRTFLLLDVLGGKLPKANLRARYSLGSNDPHLRSRSDTPASSRIGLLSEDKPASVTHYQEKDIADVSSGQQLCVPNGLHYHFYDNSAGSFVDTVNFDLKPASACTYKTSIKALNAYLFRPASQPDGPSPNTVIAGQSEVPDHMTLEKFKELATLPLGHCIQWHNIALQLVSPSVDFKDPDTILVFLQCIYQAGPPDNHVNRSAHGALMDNKLAASLLQGVRDAVQRLRANWNSAAAFGLFAAITTRVLSLRDDLRQLCLDLLTELRKITFEWVVLLSNKADQVSSNADRTTFTAKAVYTALICAATFDMDDEYVRASLHDSVNVSILIQVVITIYEGGQTKDDGLSKLMRYRIRRLMHRAVDTLSSNTSGLNDAVKRVWASYEPGQTGWTARSDLHKQWATTTTAQGHCVHLNLLDGRLLVDGSPLNQAPMSYRSQALWQPLFGAAMVKVMPASITGFEFSTKRTFAGYSIQLGLTPIGELAVQARNGTEKLQLLPNRLFSGRLPTHFSDDYIYWHNMTSDTIAVRPKADPWNSNSSHCWTLSRCHGDAWQMHQDHRRLIGLGCPTSRAVGSALKTLTKEEDTLISFFPRLMEAQIELPSRRLSFKLTSGGDRLSSNDHASMHVDQDQSVGCLIGLTNKLVLKSQHGRRLVLILDSKVSYQRLSNHMAVSVSGDQGVRVHAYTIDTLLGELANNGGLRPRLYLAYLHALTSSCLPDPLTSKTGTESALSILDSAAVFSMQQLTPQDLQLLQNIAALSPKRQYYPAHLTQMQTVGWDQRLSPLSQHSWFSVKASGVIEHYRRQHSTFQAAGVPPLQAVHAHLRERDDIRTSTFRIPGFGAEDHTDRHDQDYASRCASESLCSADVAILSKQIHTRAIARHTYPSHRGFLWQTFVAAGADAHGTSSDIALRDLAYDASLLDKTGRKYVISRFLPLCQTLSRQRATREYTITMFIAALRFSGPELSDLLQVLVTFMHSSALQSLSRPRLQIFRASLGHAATLDSITKITNTHLYSMSASSHTPPDRQPNERRQQYDRRCTASWTAASQSAVQRFAQRMYNQWPTAVPAHPAEIDHFSIYINTGRAIDDLKIRFQQWKINGLVLTYLNQIEELILGITGKKIVVSPTFLAAISSPPSIVHAITERSLLTGQPAVGQSACPALSRLIDTSGSTRASASRAHSRLDTLVGIMEKQADSAYAHRYAKDLRSSFTALQQLTQDDGANVELSSDTLSEHLAICKEHMDRCFMQLTSSLHKNSDSEVAIERMPRISTRFFLQQLNRHNWSGLSLQWKQAVVDFGLSITAFQQATRLVRLDATQSSMVAELSNPGHGTWNPMNHPEALLLEIESDILIRDIQAHVATCMLSPESATNSTIQLNMGEGKTSVIVPNIAIEVANAAQVPIVIVGKPQSKQMADMLRAKVGGLIDRRLYFMPFSRSLDLCERAIEVISDMLKECIKHGGILIMQPEHLLSFQHMAAENHLRDRHTAGMLLSSIQDYLDYHSRYIVDECDEVFSVRFEMVYSIGQQNTIDGGCSRWTLIQEILGLVRTYLALIVHQLPEQVEVRHGVRGSFPRTRLLRDEAADMLLRILASHICEHGVESLPIARQKQDVRDNIFAYLTERKISAETKSAVEQSSFWTDSTKPHLLLLRGLLAGDILAFVLRSKRWRVQYGPTQRNPTTRLAVPYNAKDCPSLRSEFSHPDVVILLTSLSHYYEGLSDEDLFNSLNLLRSSDEPDAEYALWTRDAHDLPQEFMRLQGINLEDRPQCLGRVFPALRYSKGAIDYFLNKLVFPKEMKEFPSKLSASGWDIGKTKRCLTTGFSGTADSQHLLPLMVKQLRLPESAHTDALVLDYLLQPQNSTHLMSDSDSANAWSLLSTILQLKRPVQVILDVGAQIIEETSKTFATRWLAESTQGKEAVVFVDHNDVICVADRGGHVEPLQSSPFFSRLSVCLIFLDEAHTRGIDLKLPVDYRAAVTLGARLTKDRLVQACMRMRQLGQGQTVVFCISEEIQHRILTVTSAAQIDVQSVLLWAMSETQTDVHRSVPLWAAQGQRFFKQADLWEQCRTDGQTRITKDLAASFLEHESRTIEQRYLPHVEARTIDPGTEHHPGLAQIAARCEEFENLDFDAVGLQEEQERELAVEIESERQIQRPLKVVPLPHQLHRLVKHFALKGVLTGSRLDQQEAFCGAFDSLSNISAASAFPLAQLSAKCKFLVSRDFAHTVELAADAVSDDYQRSVQWILIGCTKDSDVMQQALIISPYEANLLFKQMKRSRKSSLHMFKARVNIGNPSLDNLGFCTTSGRHEQAVLPRSLVVELALFAGQLYITSHEDYKLLCAMLGLATDSSARIVDVDGFIQQDSEGRLGGTSGLRQSPVSFMQSLLSTVRRNGESINRTHMGRVLKGRLLSEEDFDGDPTFGLQTLSLLC